MRAFLVFGLLTGALGCEEGVNCEEAPLVTYNNFGAGFVNQHCQGCHASSAPDRHDAPLGITFDDVDQVWENAELILLVATGETPIMPPRDGVFPEERELLELWLRCTEVGN